MIGQKPAQRFFQQDFSEYDIQVSETIVTDTQRDLYFKKLMDLRQAGFDIPLQWVLRYMDLPDKEQFIKFVEQQQQVAQQTAQQEQQMTLQGAMSEARLNLAKAMKEQAKAQVLPHEAMSKRIEKVGKIQMGLSKR
jgi:phage gp29-like protein